MTRSTHNIDKKATSLAPIKPLEKFRYWLLALVASLIAIYVALVWKSGDTAHLGMSILFGLVSGTLIWEKRHRLRLESQLFSKVLGILLVSFILWHGSSLLHSSTLTDNTSNLVLRVFPFISALGVGLLAFGLRGLKQCSQELIILFFLGVPSVLISFLPDISPITAKFSTFLLWCVGFDVSVQDVLITLPGGRVRVNGGCSGIENMTYLLGLSVIGLIMFPVSRIKQIITPFIAMLVGFVVNSTRIALLAVLASFQDEIAFDYWHEGSGSLIIGAISISIFWSIYLLLIRRNKPFNQELS